MPSVGFLSSRRRPSPVSTSRLSLVPLPVVSDHCRCHLVLSDWFGFLPIYLPSFTRKPPCLSSPSLPSQTVTAPPSGVSCLCLAVRSRQLVVSFRCNLHYCRYSLRRMHSPLKKNCQLRLCVRFLRSEAGKRWHFATERAKGLRWKRGQKDKRRERAWIRRRQNWLGRSVEGGVQETIVLRREVIDWCKASMRELLSVVCVLFRCLGKHVAPVAFSAPRLRVRCC